MKMEKETTGKSDLILLTFFLINLLLVIGYIFTWYRGYHLLPDDWKWGEMPGNHGYWRQWGFRDVYIYFLFFPFVIGLASLFFLKKKTIKAIFSFFFAGIMFFVALGHYWLID